MSATGLAVLLVGLGAGIPLLVGGILFIVFRATNASVTRRRGELEREGVILDSGRVWVTTRYSKFRTPRFYASGAVSKTPGYFVLTRERLVFLHASQRYGSFQRSDLGRFQVGIAKDGRLWLHSDEPPGATGSVDYRVPVTDTNAWVMALTEAGARAS